MIVHNENLPMKEMFEAIAQAIELRTAELEQMKDTLANMEALGIIDAQEHWPSDKPGALVLLYSTKSEYYEQTGQRKQYIGKKPEKIAKAKAALARFDEHKELKQKINRWQSFIDGMLVDLKRAYTASQTEPSQRNRYGW